MPTNTHRELADEAAEHRARRRWIERERDANLNLPQEEGGTQSTTTATSTPHIHPVNDIMMDSDTSDRDGLLGRAALPASVEHGWRDLRPRPANSTASIFWPVVKTLSG
eukprot:4610082-Pyramimonas_sp.AAC.1